MYISYSEGVMHIAGIEFDPQLTLIDSAQVFHWQATGTARYSGVVKEKHVLLFVNENGFSLAGVSEEEIPFWRHYFDLDRDYAAVAASCAAYPTAQRAMLLLPGMRVLNQPPWETLLSFILSANNNVSRIRQLVEKLITQFGENGAFPTPEQLSRVPEASLRAIGCGYRAPYLIRTARMVVDGFPLEQLSGMTYEEAHRALLTLPGVGDKVADCVQLFSLGHSEAFPVDVWVERLMKRWFVPDAHGKREICRRAHEMFGKNAGIIQQSLFHCARLNLIPLEETHSSSTEER